MKTLQWFYDGGKCSGGTPVATNWNDARNANRYAGTGFAGGVAGHGDPSPHETNIRLLANGPDFKQSCEGIPPTFNVGIEPTVLSLYQLPISKTMDVRVMKALLRKESEPVFQVPKLPSKRRQSTLGAPACYRRKSLS
ncbi:hypothetical protein [Persicitalea jodogahamensis]|uniref:hypothetical protein n=1 Tax=Persicitalea jodogahamensis TaxID=402147 RepID=UPI0016726E11|nr:hypothetical protein [Persicitalea jodogahamensis]